jgi:predicted RNA binding protein YcfA (HicA-like mRNA interferase family)
MPLKFKDIERILKDLWFKIDHIKGSHYVFVKDNKKITLPYHSNKDLKPKTAKTIIKQISTIANIDIKTLIKKYNIKF